MKARIISSTLLCVLAAFGVQFAWTQDERAEASSDALRHQSQPSLEGKSLHQQRSLDMLEIQFEGASLSTFSNQAELLTARTSDKSSMVELVSSVSSRPAHQASRVSHTRNPNGSFSLLRSSEESAPPLTVYIGASAVRKLGARETVVFDCDRLESPSELSIKTEKGKEIYAGEMNCGDAISVHLRAAQ